jgi:hypothetical protein
MLMTAAVKDIVTVVSNSNSAGDFQDLHARAPAFPGLIQQLEEISSIQRETRQHKDVEEFDFVGTELWNATSLLRKRATPTHGLDKPMGQCKSLQEVVTGSALYSLLDARSWCLAIQQTSPLPQFPDLPQSNEILHRYVLKTQ